MSNPITFVDPDMPPSAESDGATDDFLPADQSVAAPPGSKGQIFAPSSAGGAPPAVSSIAVQVTDLPPERVVLWHQQAWFKWAGAGLLFGGVAGAVAKKWRGR